MIILPFNGQRSGPNFTWGCEGSPDPYAERFNMFEFHVPGDHSGVTVCGYDFYQNRKTLVEDLAFAGYTDVRHEFYILKLQILADLKGNDAKAQLHIEPLAPHSAVKLFEIAYGRIEADVNRIHRSKRFTDKFFEVPELPTWVMDLIVDLRFRGDWRPYTQVALTQALVEPHLEDWVWMIRDRQRWPNVPQNRFDRRAAYAKAGWESMQTQLPHSLLIEQTKNHLNAALGAVEKIGV